MTIYLLYKENKLKKAYMSEDRARSLATFLNKRWDYGSVFRVWTITEFKVSGNR